MSAGSQAAPLAKGESARSPLTKLAPAEIKRVMADPRVVARLKLRPEINTTFDIPYLSGYSKSGKTVYIDRHFPFRALKIGSRKVNVLPFLLTHETVEKAIVDIFHKHYLYSHSIATDREEAQVRAAGINVDAYEAAFDPYLKAMYVEKLTRIPADIDFTPYVDNKDAKLVARMRAIIARTDARAMSS